MGRRLFRGGGYCRAGGRPEAGGRTGDKGAKGRCGRRGAGPREGNGLTISCESRLSGELRGWELKSARPRSLEGKLLVRGQSRTGFG
jgi:hypothetical protein